MIFRLPLGGVATVDRQTGAAAACVDVALNNRVGVAEAGVFLWGAAAQPSVEGVTAQGAVAAGAGELLGGWDSLSA